MLVDVSTVSLKTTILGDTIDFPVCIAPTSKHKLAHPLGESATAGGKRHLNGWCLVHVSYMYVL